MRLAHAAGVHNGTEPSSCYRDLVKVDKLVRRRHEGAHITLVVMPSVQRRHMRMAHQAEEGRKVIEVSARGGGIEELIPNRIAWAAMSHSKLIAGDGRGRQATQPGEVTTRSSTSWPASRLQMPNRTFPIVSATASSSRAGTPWTMSTWTVE